MQQAALARLKDARALQRAATSGPKSEPERWVGAAYLAGIALECYAKWVLCERNRVSHVDEVDPALVAGAGHDLERCLRECGLLRSIQAECSREWELARSWSVSWRYNPPGDPTPGECERFVEAIEMLFPWLRGQIT